MNEIEIIQGAREILSDPKRWKKHGWGDSSRCCLEGALGVAACGNAYALVEDTVDEVLARAEELVRKHAASNRPYDVADLATFNDDDATTHEDVLTLLDKTLADLGGL